MMKPRGLGSVTGRCSVVTGAASGIGRATALELARRRGRVALVDRDAEGLERVAAEVRGLGGQAITAALDVRDAASLSDFARRVEREFGVADLLVASAGIALVGSFLSTTAADLDELFGVNVHGTANLCRALLPAMIERSEGGHVVTLSSAAAFATPNGLVAYGATKHAVLGLSLGLADELAEHGIGVSAVCPGFVDTPIARNLAVRGESEPERTRERTAHFLKWRGLSPERVAAAVVQAAERGMLVVPVGAEAQVLSLFSRLSPRAPGALLSLGRALVSLRRT
jgi:NAD(P)-dependent dehydrogenase (short-subunit alcohol dehydrogenase family)